MSNVFYKPHLAGQKKEVFFPYSRKKLCERPIFPTYVWDGGAFFFANDQFGTADGDELLKLIVSGRIFDYWKRDGELDWTCILKDFHPIGYTSEWEGHIWIARLYILLPLAQQYCKTKDSGYARMWLDILRAWCDGNPYTTTEDWANSLVWRDMQVTWRSIIMVHSLFLLGECDAFSEEDWKFIYDTVVFHAQHLYGEGVVHAGNPKPDNHRLQIGTALIMFGTMFPELLDGGAYVETGKKIIGINLKGSIYEDGCNNEDSMSYCHFIARLYLEAELFLINNGYETIPGCAESIQRQYEFLYQFSSPAGKTLQIGDSYSMDALEDIGFVNSVYPLAFSREKKTVIFEKSRMAVLRNQRFDVFVDAMDMTEWHQHYGRPNILVYADGRPMVVDSGCVNYDRGGLRRILNSSVGHNVISCEEIPLQSYLAQTKASESLCFEKFEQLPDSQVLVITNRVAEPEGKSYLWTRTLELFEDRLEVTDSVKASEEMHFVSRLHLPDCREGYNNPNPEYQPIGRDRKTISLRFGSMMEKVIADSACEVEYQPCVDSENRMNYCMVMVRRTHGRCLEQKTVIRYDRIR